ncbi:MAG: hypothetical protein ACSHWU_08155 [Marinicella sp.]
MKFLSLFIILFISNLAQGAQCQHITYTDGSQDYSVNASINTGLHIRFFDDIQLAVLANDKVWDGQSNPSLKSHYWLFPKNRIEKDNVVGNTFILANGQTINLVVNQKIDSPSCLIIESDGSNQKIVADYSADSVKQSAHKSNELITSSYTFDRAKVRSAFDDGRFTFVVLPGDGIEQSAYSIVSIVDGDEHVIDNPTFDSLSNKYTVNGIHDLLMFSNGVTTFTVERI